MRHTIFISLLFSLGCSTQTTDSIQEVSGPTKSFIDDASQNEDQTGAMDTEPVMEPENGQSISEEPALCDGTVISPEAVDLMIDLTTVSEDEDIYLTAARLEGIADLFEACSDPWGMFPTVYTNITEQGIEAIESGQFEDRQWAEALIVDFGARYFESLNAVLTRGEPSWAWDRYYELADREDVSRTRSVMMAMSAHLLLDLPHSLAAVDTTEDHKEDFFRFGNVLMDVSDDLIVDLREHYGTDAEDILNGFFLGDWVDGAFGADTTMTLSFQTIRGKAWNNRWYIQSNMGWVASAEIYASFWAVDATLRTLDGTGIID